MALKDGYQYGVTVIGFVILISFQSFVFLEVLELKVRITKLEIVGDASIHEYVSTTKVYALKDNEKDLPTNNSLESVHPRHRRTIAITNLKGDRGVIGLRGLQGPAGLRGVDGRDGRDGMPGIPGTHGTQGPRGTKGEQGYNGVNGIPGLRGEIGQKGDRGVGGAAGKECTFNSTSITTLLQVILSANNHFTDLPSRQPVFQNIEHALKGGGTVYVRWGRTTCPTSDTGAQLVYDGIIASGYFSHAGGGGNYMCLPNDPEWGTYKDGFQSNSYIYGAEYEVKGFSPFSTENAEVLQDLDALCAVCYVPTRSVQLMIPARKTCPQNWTREYHGYVVSSHYTAHRSEYICVDEAPETRQGSYVNTEGVRLNPVEAYCGSLPCSPYVNGRELTCVTCTM